ncbi:MAG: hypothetical protein AB1486_18575 [Planctomycetota bacterium]
MILKCTFLSLILLSPVALGQQPSSTPATPAQNVQNPLAQKIDVDFKGGTLGEFVEAIARQSGVTPNVIVSEEAVQVVLPPIKLRGVAVVDLLMSLQFVSTGPRLGVLQKSSDIVALLIDKPRNPRLSSVFDVKPVLGESVRIDDIVTAITTAWKMLSPSHTGELKYHPETHLLIAVGAQDELGIVRNVLAELSNRADREAASQKAGVQEGELRRLSESVEILLKEIDLLKAEMAMLRVTVKEGR